MSSVHIDIENVEWTSAVPFYGPGAVYQGQEIVQLKVLCDRRHEDGGITWVVKFTPPAGKLIKIIAVALSDEHVFILDGGRTTKSGRPSKTSSGYSLNPKGQPHSAMIAAKMTALIIYVGDPDDVKSIEIVDIAASGK
ncbi:MAG: hypothetical protein ABIT70_05140 [Sulfuriferula sp.]